MNFEQQNRRRLLKTHLIRYITRNYTQQIIYTKYTLHMLQSGDILHFKFMFYTLVISHKKQNTN